MTKEKLETKPMGKEHEAPANGCIAQLNLAHHISRGGVVLLSLTS